MSATGGYALSDEFQNPAPSAQAGEVSEQEALSAMPAGSPEGAAPTEAGKAKRTSRTVLKAVFAVCLAGAIGGGAYLVNAAMDIHQAQERQQQAPAPAMPLQAEPETSSTAAEEPELPDNPIDFDALHEQSPDACGWIAVPDTQVNYPVMQHPSDNTFYLTHNEQGEDAPSGAVFTELYNRGDFSDPVTILYGHNGYGDLYFSTLHQFRDADFFDAHPEFYVYVPGHVYTYTIASAFVTDDRHLFSVYNFAKKDQLLQFEQDIMHPSSVSENTRSDVKLDEDSRFVVLSTCNPVELGYGGRYLVCGVLTDDTPTK